MAVPTFDSIPDREYDPRLYAPVAEVEPIASLAEFGPAQMEQYRTLGFVSVANVIDPERNIRIVKSLLRLADEVPEGICVQFESAAEQDVLNLPIEERQDYIRKYMAFVKFDDVLCDLAYDPEILSVIERLLKDKDPTVDGVELFQDMALFKPPGIGREKPWHQDHAYFNVPEGTPVIGIWMALDEANLENGCMVFQPGGHLDGPVPHFSRRDWQICDSDVLAKGGSVAAPLPAGGALIFDGLTPHGTPSNRSGQRRRAIQFHYIPKGTPRTTTEERMRIFGSEGRDVSC
ncbi:MAG TPA: phytanoyl-CoA dioxygenase family protein [Fimbriimonadaceae bacterium]|nr:phytanoyl-CoA dioxygenase family protein [Fimbriimonadaceae bacterium]